MQAVVNEDTRGDEGSLRAEIQRLRDELAAYQSEAQQAHAGQQPHAETTPGRGHGGSQEALTSQAPPPFTPVVSNLLHEAFNCQPDPEKTDVFSLAHGAKAMSGVLHTHSKDTVAQHGSLNVRLLKWRWKLSSEQFGIQQQWVIYCGLMEQTNSADEGAGRLQ